MPYKPDSSNSGVLEEGQVPPTKPASKPPPRNKESFQGESSAPEAAESSVPPPPSPKKRPAAQPAVRQNRKAETPQTKANTAQDAEAQADEDGAERATAASWQQMAVVYTVSMILHAAILMVLGLIVLPQDVRDEILNVVVEEPEPVDPPPLDTVVEEPDLIEDVALEETPTDPTAMVESEADAEETFNLDFDLDKLQVKPEADEGPTLPFKTGDISSGRSKAARAKMLQERGGNAASDAAVGYALDWLVSVQRRDGSWDFNDVGEASGAGNLSSPTGATGLALMAFLGAGHTHMKDCKHQDNVKRGLIYLLKAGIRRPEGLDFRGRSPGNEGMYVQAICATALAEALGMTNDRRIRPIAQGAINFIVRAQHPTGGGWRYKPQQKGDTSVVGWQVMALKSAYHSDIRIPRTVAMGTKKFLSEVSHEDGAQYSYMRGQRPKPSTTSIGLLCRMYMGWKPENPALIEGVKYLAKRGPSKGDIYYDYYASQVMIQFTGAKGELWDKWNTTMRDWLVETQIKSGPAKGSWDVIEKGHKGSRGGRLYTTCLAVMTLEIYYRVMPLYKRAAVEGEF